MHAKGPVCTHPVPAVGAPEARLTQTAPVDVVTAGPVSTVTHTFTVLTKTTYWTLLTALVSSEAFSALTLSALGVTVAPVVTHTLL